MKYNNPCSYCYKNNIGYRKQYNHNKKKCGYYLTDKYIKQILISKEIKQTNEILNKKAYNNKAYCIPIITNYSSYNNIKNVNIDNNTFHI